MYDLQQLYLYSVLHVYKLQRNKEKKKSSIELLKYIHTYIVQYKTYENDHDDMHMIQGQYKKFRKRKHL